MIISDKSWQEYLDRLRRVNSKAADLISQYIQTHEIESHEGHVNLLDYVSAVVTKYSEGAAEAACEMYDAIAEASGKVVPPAEPAPTPTFGDVAKTLNGTMKHMTDPDGIGASCARLVKRTGVDTTMKNALRDGAEWAWIPHGDTCGFCLMLASQGWVKASKKAIRNGHAEHIHPNCDCTYAIRFNDSDNVAGYDPDALYEKYLESGSYRGERLANMQREYRNKSDDGDNDIKGPKKKRHVSSRDVTKYYLEDAEPGHGNIDYEPGFNKNERQDELSMAIWIHNNLGGNIVLKEEARKDGVKNPDYDWLGAFWDLKTTSTAKSANSAIKSGMKQIRQNPGGIILNFGNHDISLDELHEVIDKRMIWYPKESADIMIVAKGKLLEVLRY